MTSFRLHHGDAIELMRSLPDASIDMIDTDTAYESLEEHRKVGTTTRLKQSAASSNEWFEIFKNERFPEFFAEAFRVLKKNTHLYFFCDRKTEHVAVPIAEAAGFKWWNSLVWVKTNGPTTAESLDDDKVKTGLGYHYRRSNELIVFMEKGKRKLNDLSVCDTLPFPPVHKGYPTEKPVDLHKVLIANSTQPGETVLDPFMGSGSAGSAAIRLGRSFIGGDLKDTAVALARQRCLGAGGKEDTTPFVSLPSEPKKEPSAAMKRLAAGRLP